MSADKILTTAASVLSKAKFSAPYSSIGGFTANTGDASGGNRMSAHPVDRHQSGPPLFSDRDVDSFHGQGELGMLQLLQFDSDATYHKISDKDKCVLYESLNHETYTVKGVATVFTHLSEVMDLLSCKDPHFASVLAKLLGPIHADNRTLFAHDKYGGGASEDDDEHALLVTWLALQASSSAAVNNDHASAHHLRTKVTSAQHITREFCFLRYSGYFTVEHDHVARVLPSEPLTGASQAVSIWESIHHAPASVVQHPALLGRFVKTGFILEQAKAPNAVKVNFIMSTNLTTMSHARQGASEKLFLQRMVRTILLNMSAAVMELRLVKDHLLAKHSFTDSSMCTICLKTFSFLRRKHHCRLCGDAFCTTCSLSRARPEMGDAVRVCHACIEGNPSSLVRSSDKLFALHRPTHMFRHASARGTHHPPHKPTTKPLPTNQPKWSSSWSNSARGMDSSRGNKSPPPPAARSQPNNPSSAFLPNGTIHLGDFSAMMHKSTTTERKKSAPTSPVTKAPVFFERKKSAPTYHDASDHKPHPMAATSGRKSTSDRFHKSPKGASPRPRSFKSPGGAARPVHAGPPSPIYPYSPTTRPDYDPHPHPAFGYDPTAPRFGFPEDVPATSSFGKAKPATTRSYDDQPAPEPIHFNPGPPPRACFHSSTTMDVDPSDCIYHSTPFYYPLNFHNGNPWPDAPLTDYEDERLEKARSLDLLRRRDDILMYVRIAAKTMHCPVATICIVGGSAGLLIAKIGGVTTDTIPRQVMLESHAILSHEPTVVLDCLHDLRFATNPLVCDNDVGIRFYVGVPLCTSDGLVLGVLSLVDTRPREFVRRSELHRLLQVAETIMHRFEDMATSEQRQQDAFQRQYELDLDID
ncbi:Aste57867_16543 [Aphanomyces stellatus]|uniref:Aste57867_16543 protein n=1 Tax=Aphanomyces stellatus TaxID=120398 RepID=A0A485L5P0_9STRA|nr:hypothetical protein As57867_016486 [Aphanomyces stellatus]VFT93317.1 Aste57867_16543 [Aphanomyces stellatus]